MSELNQHEPQRCPQCNHRRVEPGAVLCVVCQDIEAQKLVDDLWLEHDRWLNAIMKGPSSDRPIAIENALKIASAALGHPK